MALLMFEGFEGYSKAADLLTTGRWSGTGGNGVRLNSTSARSGGGCVMLDNSSYLLTTAPFALAGTTLIAGFGYSHSRGDGYGDPMVEFRDGTGHVLCELRIGDTDNVMRLYSGSGTLLGPIGTVLTGAYGYVEVKIVFGASGSIIARMDGAETAHITGIDTVSGGGAFSSICFGNSNATGYLDDIYICDDSGTAQNDFLGPVRIYALDPDGDVETGWAPDTGTTHYTQVGSDDGDTSYVAATTTGARDIYSLAAPDAAYANPVAVQIVGDARTESGAGPTALGLVTKVGTAEVEDTSRGLGLDYRVVAGAIQPTNPETGAAWTAADLDALQVGVVLRPATS